MESLKSFIRILSFSVSTRFSTKEPMLSSQEYSAMFSA